MHKTIVTMMSRRSILVSALAGTSVITFGWAARAQTLEKSAVSYQEEPKGDQMCSNCTFFIPNESDTAAPGACTMVKGEILPQAWCAIWAPIA